jgi:hypothetical protein
VRFDDRIHQSGGPRVKALPPLFYALFTGAYFTYTGILALAPEPERGSVLCRDLCCGLGYLDRTDLFSELPRRILLGNPVSGIQHSRKLTQPQETKETEQSTTEEGEPPKEPTSHRYGQVLAANAGWLAPPFRASRPCLQLVRRILTNRRRAISGHHRAEFAVRFTVHICVIGGRSQRLEPLLAPEVPVGAQERQGYLDEDKRCLYKLIITNRRKPSDNNNSAGSCSRVVMAAKA